MAAIRELDRSLESTYRAHYPALFRRARRWLPTDEAEDLVQETFLRAWAHHGGSDPGVPWLMTVLRNLAIDRSRRIHPDLTDDPDALRRPASGDETAEKVVALEDRRRVRRALATLTSEQRTVITLREWAGLSQREIADSLGTTVHSVESLLLRGRRRLRKALDHAMGLLLWPTAEMWRKLKGAAGTQMAAGPGAAHGWTATMASLATAATVLAAGGAASLGGHDGGSPAGDPMPGRVAPVSASFQSTPAERGADSDGGTTGAAGARSAGGDQTAPGPTGTTSGDPVAPESPTGGSAVQSDGDSSGMPSPKGAGPATGAGPAIDSDEDPEPGGSPPHADGDGGGTKSRPVANVDTVAADNGA